MTKNALHSLYGEGHVNATRARECVAMPGKRDQSILTPQCIVDGLQKMWPQGVACDPCGHPDSLLDPDLDVHPAAMVRNGLGFEWPERTYCNPPYGELKKWLDHGGSFFEVVWLVPMRTHRRWFRAWLWLMDVRLALDPLKFVGFEQMYPAPLLLGYKGNSEQRFIDAFEHLGGLL